MTVTAHPANMMSLTIRWRPKVDGQRIPESTGRPGCDTPSWNDEKGPFRSVGLLLAQQIDWHSEGTRD
jgi:hypothetical protein